MTHSIHSLTLVYPNITRNYASLHVFSSKYCHTVPINTVIFRLWSEKGQGDNDMFGWEPFYSGHRKKALINTVSCPWEKTASYLLLTTTDPKADIEAPCCLRSILVGLIFLFYFVVWANHVAVAHFQKNLTNSWTLQSTIPKSRKETKF